MNFACNLPLGRLRKLPLFRSQSTSYSVRCGKRHVIGLLRFGGRDYMQTTSHGRFRMISCDVSGFDRFLFGGVQVFLSFLLSAFVPWIFEDFFFLGLFNWLFTNIVLSPHFTSPFLCWFDSSSWLTASPGTIHSSPICITFFSHVVRYDVLCTNYLSLCYSYCNIPLAAFEAVQL